MVASPNIKNEIIYFKNVKINQKFASTKVDANYIKIDDISGQKIDGTEIKLFDDKELVYIGTIFTGKEIY